jgi:hypothetical protein
MQRYKMLRLPTPSILLSTTNSLRPCLNALVFVAIGLAGCQKASSSAPTFDVRGKVLLSSGKPLSAGRITFVSTDGSLPEVSGDIQSDGGFALTTRTPGDGAAPGKYKVRIEPMGRRDARKSKLSFPAKYVDEDSSGIVVTVQAEANQLDPFTLK